MNTTYGGEYNNCAVLHTTLLFLPVCCVQAIFKGVSICVVINRLEIVYLRMARKVNKKFVCFVLRLQLRTKNFLLCILPMKLTPLPIREIVCQHIIKQAGKTEA